VVMAKVGRALGLIRYGSRDSMEGRASSWVRLRVFLYPAALAVVLGLLVWQLGTRADTEVTVLRGKGAPFTFEADGSIVNQVRLKIANRSDGERHYGIALEGGGDARLIAPINPFPVPAHRTAETSVFVVLPCGALPGGRRDVTIRIADTPGSGGFVRNYAWRLVGPAAAEVKP